jgi:hypothetical protein
MMDYMETEKTLNERLNQKRLGKKGDHSLKDAIYALSSFYGAITIDNLAKRMKLSEEQIKHDKEEKTPTKKYSNKARNKLRFFLRKNGFTIVREKTATLEKVYAKWRITGARKTNDWIQLRGYDPVSRYGSIPYVEEVSLEEANRRLAKAVWRLQNTKQFDNSKYPIMKDENGRSIMTKAEQMEREDFFMNRIFQLRNIYE